MACPHSQDYNEAIQNPVQCFADAELKRGEAVTNEMGLPQPFSGNFADVYAVTSGERKWAVKCFTRQIPGLRERYKEVSAYLKQVALPFMVEFSFLEQGIRVRSDWFPALKMQWVEGFTLNDFVRRQLHKPHRLEILCQLWVKLASRLREANLAHCDLQHGNVLLVPGRKEGSLAVKLVDYDGMCVPALTLLKSIEVGHPSYQHPQRAREGIYGLECDRFPHLVIYTALKAIMFGGKTLWDKYDNGDNLLFNASDFAAPAKSALFAELLRSGDTTLRILAETMVDALSKPLSQTPLLEEVTAKLPAPKAAVAAEMPTAEDLFASATASGSLPMARPPVRKQSKVGLLVAVTAGLLVLVGGAVGYLATQRGDKNKLVAKGEQTLKNPDLKEAKNEPDPKPPEAKSPATKSSETIPQPKSPEPKSPEPKSPEPKSPEPKTPEPKPITNPTAPATPPTAQPKFTPVLLGTVASCSSPRLFDSGIGAGLPLPAWGAQEHLGVPFDVIDPRGGKVKNVISLFSPKGDISRTMPKTVSLPCDTAAQAVHILGGVSGWGFPGIDNKDKTVSMTVRLVMDNGDIQERKLVNSVDIGDWLFPVDLPGSKRVPLSNKTHVRMLSINLDKPGKLKSVEFVKGEDTTSPVVMAVTIESAGSDAKPGTLPQGVTNSIGMKLVLVPAGEFMMGSPNTEAQRQPTEGPQHKVKITKPFFMGAYEVTQGEYEKVMGNNPSRFKDPNNPVEQVNWNDAVEFCSKLSNMPEEKRAGRTYRLPTEAEWEYACRAGTTTPFHYGNSLLPKDANFSGTPNAPKNSQAAKVGSYQPNAWGLYDMHGNVWEWCLDGPRRFSNDTMEDPKGDLSAGGPRVLRGGGAAAGASSCRSANSNPHAPTVRSYDVGFRVVCALDQASEILSDPTDEVFRFKGDFATRLPSRSLTFPKEGKTLLAMVKRGYVIGWDLGTKQPTREIPGQDFSTPLGFSEDGRTAFVKVMHYKTGTESLCMVDIATGKETKRHTYPIKQGANRPVELDGVFLLPDARRAFASWRGGASKIIDMESGKELLTFRQPMSPPIVSPDGKIGISRVRSNTGTGAFIVWNVDDGKELKTITGVEAWEICHLAFLPDGKRFLCCYTGRCSTWDVATGKEVGTLKLEGRPLATALTGDGRTLLYAESNTIHVVNIDSGKEVQRFDGHYGSITNLAVSPDGKYAASGASDGTVRLWRLRKTEPPKRPADAVVFANHHYKVFWEYATWEEARQKCADMGGHLAYLETDEEQKFVASLKGKDKVAWVGGSLDVKARKWHWLNGVEVDPKRVDEQLVPGYHYLFLTTDGILRSRPLNGIRPKASAATIEKIQGYICEWDD